MAANGGGGYAAGVLREMYGNSLPRAAQQLLQDHAKSRSSSEPPLRAKVFSTAMFEHRASKKVDLKVPRVGQRKTQDTEGVAKPPKMPTRRPLAQILLETSNYERQLEPPPLRGRDCGDAEKWRLQDQYSFGFGSALPTTSVPPGMPAPSASSPSRAKGRSLSLQRSGARRVSFDGREAAELKTGLTNEQESLATDIIHGVRDRQRELDTVEQALADLTTRSEARGEGGARSLIRKEMIGASKRRLEIRNAIQRDVQDLEKLFDCSPEG
mmetsp:Transcript_40349/g.72680  ORF Transcript_40349/g.72680 Transcript_40349/m.72680 type:complete len:269 (-) Transcript_40349:55-861(-)